MSNIDMNSEIRIKGGKKYNMVEFAETLGLDIMNTPVVIATAKLLEKQGRLTVVDKTTKEEKMLDEAIKEQVFQEVVNNLDAEEEAHRAQIREQKLEDTDRLKITLSFVTTLEAQKFMIWLNGLGITEVSELRKNGALKLLIENITPQEYSKIANKYKAEKAISATVDTTGKILNGTTNAVNYGLTEMVAPTAKLVGEAGMNIGKGLIHTLIKTGAGLINSGAKAVVDTKVALVTDPECLRAQSQLMNAKNNIKRQVASRVNQTGISSGIEIL